MTIKHVCEYIQPPSHYVEAEELSDLSTQIFIPRPKEEIATLESAREAAIEHEASTCRQAARDHAASVCDETRTAVYRLSDASGRLLYVGQGTHPLRRWAGHSHDKEWWPEVTQFSLEWCDSHTEAMVVEAHAIRNERPLHNIVHNRRRPKTQAERILPPTSDHRWVRVSTGVRRPAHWIDAE